MSVAYAETEESVQSDRIPVAELVSKLPANVEVSDEPGVLIIREGWLHVGHFIGLIVLMILSGLIFTLPPAHHGSVSGSQPVVTDDDALPIITPAGADRPEPWQEPTRVLPTKTTAYGSVLAITSHLRSFNAASMLFWAAFVVCGYWALAGFVNHSILQVTEESIERSVGPLPTSGNFFFSVDDVDQLYAERCHQPWRRLRSVLSSLGSRRRSMTFSDLLMGPRMRALMPRSGNYINQHTDDRERQRRGSAYRLVLLKLDGSRMPVSCAYNVLNPTRILEYLIEARMSIADRPVAAEAKF